MTRKRVVLGGVALLLVAGALVFYFAFLPGMLADDWEKKARQEHETAAMAFPRVFATFSELTFGIDASQLAKAKTAEAYIKEVQFEAGFYRDNLKDVKVTIQRARRDIAAVDQDALVDVPEPPLIGTSGKLGDAHDIAALERRYLDTGRDFLRRYEKFVDFQLKAVREAERAQADLAKGLDSIPTNPGSVEAFTKPTEATAARLARHASVFRRMKPPPALRDELRATTAAYSFYARVLRGLVTAVRKRDLARIERFDKDFKAASKRYTRGEPQRLERVLHHSTYSRTIARMNRLGDRIQRAHLELGAS